MEETSITISKNVQLPLAEDYDLLRAKGFNAIQELGNAQWTDYNAHDPGITLLEALTYALTELGYRTGIDIADILTEPSGYISFRQALFTARRILTNNPLTVNDFRKAMIDLPKVANAWFLCKRCACETQFYAECDEDALFHAPQWRLQNADNGAPVSHEHSVFVSGLYEVLLHLDRDTELGDLNTHKLVHTTTVSSGVGNERLPLTIELRFFDWKREQPELYGLFTGAHPDFTFTNIQVDRFSRDRVVDEIVTDDSFAQGWRNLFFADFTVAFETVSGGTEHSFQLQAVPIRFFSLAEQVKNSSNIVAAVSDILQEVSPGGVWDRYRRKLLAISEAVASARFALHDLRNLGEDFCKIETIQIEDVAFCADVEVAIDADIEYVLAHIFYAIEKHFNPAVPFYTLQELAEEGWTTEEIFQGPPLENGFIKDEDLGTSELRAEIHISDLYNELMDIPGLKAIKHVLFTRYDDEGNPIMPAHQWHIPIRALHIPRLYQLASRVLFYKNNLPFLARMDEVQAILAQLRGQDLQGKVPLAARDYPIPVGRNRNLAGYTPVQHTLPLTYGTGPAGLDPRETVLRHAQARQLKGFLLPFEQLLADMNQQLAHTPDLFSTDEQIDSTYFNHFFDPSLVPSEITDLDVLATTGFTEANLRQLSENASTYEDRRNRFLDHMLARFGEQFRDYGLMLYANADRIPFSNEKLIRDKIRFLRFYPRISADRARSFNYRYTDRWCDPRNQTGLSERLGRLLGMESLKAYFNVEITSQFDVFSARFELENNGEGGPGTLLQEVDTLTASTGEGVEEAVWEWIGNVIGNCTNAGQYAINGSETILQDENGDDLALLATGVTTDQVVDFCNDILRKERLFTVEHVLLRPTFPGSPLMEVCLGSDCNFCGEEDPYSFRLTYVLQGNLEPFSYDIDLRNFADRTIRKETPSHLLPKICWVGNLGFVKNECAPVFSDLVELLQQEQGMDAQAETTCDCANSLYDGFDEIFQTYMEGQELAYRDRAAWETGLRNLFLLLDPSDFPCLISDNGWDVLRDRILNHFVDLAVTAHQFDRFEQAWCLWLEANDPFDWFVLNQQLQRQTELWLQDGLATTGGRNTCACAELLTAYFGDRYRQWIDHLVEEEIDLEDAEMVQDQLQTMVWDLFLEDLGIAMDNDPEFCQGIDLAENDERWEALRIIWFGFYTEWVEVSYRLNILLRIFTHLKSIYPTATLHDCDDGSDDNPVRLDNTILGNL